jgi:Uma2 family endonuclease
VRRPATINYMTEAEYLAAEELAQTRHEYVNGYVFAMTGATDAHNVITGNLFAFLHGKLRGCPCRAYVNDMRVRIESVRSYYYPDIMVSCEGFDCKSKFKTSPVLLIEVLSPSTAGTDRREKLMAYQKIPSLREYLIVYQDRQRLELYRKGSDNQWEFAVLDRPDDDLVLESLPVQSMVLPFSVIYEEYAPPFRVTESVDESLLI